LATNAADSNESAIVAALSRVGIDGYFDHIFCFETVGHRKPSSLYYDEVLEKLGLPADRVFMVGDDFEVDVLGATAVGIRSVWLNTLTCEKRFGACYATVHSFESLLEELQALGYGC
jgi:FMN phosphatase YigB (HAD superfamily)